MESIEPTNERAALVARILEQLDGFFQILFVRQAQAWLAVDLTMPQLKTLLIVQGLGSATGGQMARGLGVGLSTVTGIVDRLCEQGLVTRGEDPTDRRITRVVPTDGGRRLASRFSRFRREHMRRLLDRLDLDQLETVELAFTHLARAAADLATEGDGGEPAGDLPKAVALSNTPR